MPWCFRVLLIGTGDSLVMVHSFMDIDSHRRNASTVAESADIEDALKCIEKVVKEKGNYGGMDFDEGGKE